MTRVSVSSPNMVLGDRRLRRDEQLTLFYKEREEERSGGSSRIIKFGPDQSQED